MTGIFSSIRNSSRCEKTLVVRCNWQKHVGLMRYSVFSSRDKLLLSRVSVYMCQLAETLIAVHATLSSQLEVVYCRGRRSLYIILRHDTAQFTKWAVSEIRRNIYTASWSCTKSTNQTGLWLAAFFDASVITGRTTGQKSRQRDMAKIWRKRYASAGGYDCGNITRNLAIANRSRSAS